MWLKLKRALHCPCVLQLQTHLDQIKTCDFVAPVLQRPQGDAVGILSGLSSLISAAMTEEVR